MQLNKLILSGRSVAQDKILSLLNTQVTVN